MARHVGTGVAAALAAVILFTVPAKAATYSFSYQGGVNDPTVSGSGTFTTNAANNLVIAGSGVFSMGSVSGGTSLFPVTAYTAGFNSDNVFPIDSSAGILFEGTTNLNFFANIFAPTGTSLGVGASDAWFSATNGGGYLWGSLGFAGVCTHCVADGTLRISATPLPSTWGMMLLGLGVLGFMGYRRRNTAASYAV
jgi:PEP-CTERM motif